MAKRGFVYDIDRAEYVMNDTKHPQSLLKACRAARTCETRGESIPSSDEEEHGFSVRFPKLATNDVYFFVGRRKYGLGLRTRSEL